MCPTISDKTGEPIEAAMKALPANASSPCSGNSSSGGGAGGEDGDGGEGLSLGRPLR